MKLSSRIPFVLALIATPVLAQSTARLKKELRTMERAAKKDPEALFEAGSWAKEQRLAKDAKRIFLKVLKITADHAGANIALGNEFIDGKWLSAKLAKRVRDAALEAKYSTKGFKKIDDIWVGPEQLADARKGIFHHEGELVSHDEKLALQAGKVRHPVTGRLIDAQFADKASNGYFPLRNGKWGDRKEANKFHSEVSRPWVIRSEYTNLISTLPIEKLETLTAHADQGYEKVAPLFGGRQITPAKRPTIIIAKSRTEYNQYGKRLGDGTDVAGAFLITADAEFNMADQGIVRPAICVNDKQWGVYYIRHASALAYVNAIAEEAGADLPLWFVHGVGSYTSRFQNESNAGWFGVQHLGKGGVGNVKSFFSTFDLSPDINSTAVDFNIFQAGLMLDFATHGGDKTVTDAMVAVTEALSGKGKNSASKAITHLEQELTNAQDKIVEHLAKLITKAPK